MKTKKELKKLKEERKIVKLTNEQLEKVVGGNGYAGDVEGSEPAIPSEDNHSINW